MGAAVTDQEKRARERIRTIVRNSAPHSLSKKGNRQFFLLQMQTQTTEWLVEAAREGDADALDILRERSREARQTRADIPYELSAFVWEYFIDGAPKARLGPSPKSHTLRNMIIVSLVKVVHEEFGFPIQRNVEHRNKKTGPVSACSLVAQELALSESSIADIWANRETT